jgi:hypothetical protein
MNLTKQTLAATFVIALAANCANQAPPTATRSALTTSITPGQTMASFEAYYPTRSSTEIGSRLVAIADAALGTQGADTSPLLALSQRHVQTGPWSEAVSYQNTMFNIEYFPATDDVRVSNMNVKGNRSAAQDVGEVGARAVAAKVLSKLDADQIIPAANYDLSTAQVSHTMHGSSQSNQEPTPSILEYRFLLRRRLNGIEFLNNGVLISVSRTGDVASIRLGGALVKSVVSADGSEQPTGSGQTFAAATTSAALSTRFTAEIPNAVGVKSRLWYVFSNADGTGLIEPRQVVLYSQSHSVPGGQTALSKGRYLAYSFHGVNDQPSYLTGIPVPAPTGDVIKR